MDRLLSITTRLASFFFILPPAVLAVIWYKTKYAAPLCRPAPPFIDQFLGAGIVLFAVLMAITAYVTKAMAPRGYSLNDIELVIDREMKPITIPLAEILEVRPVEDGLLRGSLRLMGTSGYYGYYGLFWKKGVGRYRAYATRLKGLVYVKTEKTLFVLSPENPEDFISTLGGLLRR